MSTGAAMGNGIYMADSLSVSSGYAGARGGGGGHWPQSATGTGGTPVIVAVCEVINRRVFVAQPRTLEPNNEKWSAPVGVGVC